MRLACPKIMVYTAKEILENFPKAFDVIVDTYVDNYMIDDWWDGCEDQMFLLTEKQAEILGRSPGDAIGRCSGFSSFDITYPRRHLSLFNPELASTGPGDLFVLAGFDRELSNKFLYEFQVDSPHSLPRTTIEVSLYRKPSTKHESREAIRIGDAVSDAFDEFIEEGLNRLDELYEHLLSEEEVCIAMDGIEFTSNGAQYMLESYEEKEDE